MNKNWTGDAADMGDTINL